ncbi:MAG: hypothetical protein LQ340_006996, partial [Diploschistes diacapsis]
MTSKVQSLQRASLKNPVRISVSSDMSPSFNGPNSTSSMSRPPPNLLQSYLFIPHKLKDHYLVHLLTLSPLTNLSAIVFARTINTTQRLSLLLRALGLSAIPLH